MADQYFQGLDGSLSEEDPLKKKPRALNSSPAMVINTNLNAPEGGAIAPATAVTSPDTNGLTTAISLPDTTTVPAPAQVVAPLTNAASATTPALTEVRPAAPSPAGAAIQGLTLKAPVPDLTQADMEKEFGVKPEPQPTVSTIWDGKTVQQFETPNNPALGLGSFGTDEVELRDGQKRTFTGSRAIRVYDPATGKVETKLTGGRMERDIPLAEETALAEDAAKKQFIAEGKTKAETADHQSQADTRQAILKAGGPEADVALKKAQAKHYARAGLTGENKTPAQLATYDGWKARLIKQGMDPKAAHKEALKYATESKSNTAHETVSLAASIMKNDATGSITLDQAMEQARTALAPPPEPSPAAAAIQGDASKHMPLPKGLKGKIVRDTNTGKRYQSDGNKWTEVQ